MGAQGDSDIDINLHNMMPPPNFHAPGPPPPTGMTSDEPYVEIVEQPRAHGLRFRYQCEGRSAGSIPGENSSAEHKTFPTIEIKNMDCRMAIVVVSLVTKDTDKPRPHPHSLVGRDCQKGVCTVKLKNTHTITFPNLGIQCATKKQVKEALKQREDIRVDPFQTGYYSGVSTIDLNVLRLCFQVFLPDQNGRFTRALQPLASQCIYDKKAVNDLVICRLSCQAGSVKGGNEVFLLCEKVVKDDIQVRFFEENGDGVIWESYGDFSVGDVHRQYAIVFRTPPYKDQKITSPAQVFLQLKRQSDGMTSDSKPFQYIPKDPDPDGVSRKRTRKGVDFSRFAEDCISRPTVGGVSTQTKDRLKKYATRKTETPGGLPATAAATATAPAPMAFQPTVDPTNFDFSNPNMSQQGAVANPMMQGASANPMISLDAFQAMGGAGISTVDQSDMAMDDSSQGVLPPATMQLSQAETGGGDNGGGMLSSGELREFLMDSYPTGGTIDSFPSFEGALLDMPGLNAIEQDLMQQPMAASSANTTSATLTDPTNTQTQYTTLQSFQQ